MAFSRKLCKAFAAVAIFGAAMTVAAPPAQAISPVHVVIITNSAANSAAAAARHRHDREATNEVIVNPSDQAIANLRSRGLVEAAAVPYVRESVAEMNIPAGTKADNVTEAQRDQLARLVNQKWLVAQMSADNSAGAQAKGLSEGLAKYFDATKAELGYSGTVTLAQARAMDDSMGAKHWENDTKPALEKAGIVIGGLALAGGAAYAVKRRYDYNKYGY